MMHRFAIPSVGEPSPVRFPPVSRQALANGIRVWSLEQRAVPAVTITCLADAGSSSDPADRPGLASLTAALMSEGAGALDSIALADALARIGGQLEIEAGADAATLTLTVLSRHFEAGLKLVADIVHQPRLAEPDFARVRELRLGRLKQLSRTPAAAAD